MACVLHAPSSVAVCLPSDDGQCLAFCCLCCVYSLVSLFITVCLCNTQILMNLFVGWVARSALSSF